MKTQEERLKRRGVEYLDSEIKNGVGGILSHIEKEIGRDLGSAVVIKERETKEEEGDPI